MIIGIIGKVGSGKSACVKYITSNYPAISYSCDEVAKELINNGEVDYKPCTPYEFFTDEKKQEECRQKVHSKVFLRICENINNSNNCEELIHVIETALPQEMLYNICDKVICVENTYEKKTQLLKEHRDYTDNQIKLIYDSQSFYDKYYAMADYKIDNNGTKEDMLKKVKEVMDEICIICK